MCLLAVQYKLVPESPILVAANREEYFDRPSLPPSIQSGKPRVLCGIDQKAGGTWLGVNQNGLFVGVCNRATAMPLFGQRSRGSLVMDLLRCTSASKALDKALVELSETQYEGLQPDDRRCEIWLRDPFRSTSASGRTGAGAQHHRRPQLERSQKTSGCEWHVGLLTLQTLDSPVKFLAVASRVSCSCSRSARDVPSMVIRNQDYGTVSSSLIALGVKPRDAIYQFSNGAPDQTKYEDCSPMLRDILSRGLRESRNKAKVTA